MKKIKLNHNNTPPNLIPINQELEGVLSSEELDDKRLLELIVKRDDLITAHLDGLDVDAKKAFATAEYDTNQRLTQIAETLFRTSLSKLSGLLRGRKAVEKYK